ncbi:integral membrane protein [Saccharata proteae CBS 121410]|uniref:Integral membrane protein n=1 Tax=Saccharata proteae CBS 121410 TaxID=1314787 RepID=A0A6A5YBZ5_9PEZI|nr:integral membrane protein [Saccharata proteae CBS 121410]
MGAFKNIVEPGLIALAFTTGALINRRPKPKYADSLDEEHRAPLLTRERSHDAAATNALAGPVLPHCPDNSVFRQNITSRFLAYAPFLIEIWYWNLTYWTYQLARALSATLIRNNESIFAASRSHSLSILSLEHTLRIDIERGVQQYILSNMPWLMPILAKVYYSHIVVGVVFIVYTYTCLPLPLFQTIRRTMAVDNVLAFIVLTAWRCMPPRLLPKEYGYVDILHGGSVGGESAWTNNRFQLTIAAMPSLHFGNAAFLAVCLCRFSPHRVVRYLAWLWPIAMLLTIVATANHFLMDAVVGALIPVIGWRLNKCMLWLRPIEEWGFWLLRTEKPLVTRTGRANTPSRGNSPEPAKTAERMV